MPQDSLRSIVYRSFVTCDDPGGVVECKTIRRSKAAKKGGKVENAKSEKNLVASSSHKDIRKGTSLKGSIDKLDSSSSVDSFSKNTLESQSEDIAKNLLKGAVSLQESLNMLGKLQEASKFMRSFKRKEKSGNGKSLQRSYSERFTDHSNVIEFQKPRLSADGGSSKDCYDELRDVIRESFARQNILREGSSGGREFVERNVDSSIDSTAASSSQSSMFNSHDFISSDSSSSIAQSERPKGSNLIAKLMGLDELTTEPMQSIPKKPSEKRAILDLDLPISRKPSFIVHKAKPDQRTLGEIIEIMQSKGLMRDKSFDEPTKKWYPYEVAEFCDDSPPIVVIKPLHNSSLDKEYPLNKNCTCGRASADTKEMLKLWRMREGVSSEKLRPREALNNSPMQRKSISDKHAVTRISREKATKSFGEVRARPKDKESEIQQNRPHSRPKASHLQKGEVIEKRADRTHRVAPKAKNKEERTPIKESNAGRATISNANHQGSKIPREPIASSKISRSRTTKTLPSSSKQRKSIKSEKLNEKQTPVSVEVIGNSSIDIEINPTLENVDIVKETRITPEHVSFEERVELFDICFRDDPKVSSESPEIIIQQNMFAKCDQSDNSEVSSISSLKENRKPQTTVRALLSSSISFLNLAEELFDITTGQSVLLDASILDEEELPDAKLILPCAIELLERKCQQWELTVYPLRHPKQKPKISVSLEHLVGRVSDDIRKLKDINRLSGDDLLVDYLYTKLEKDLWSNGGGSGAWALGWMNTFSWDEVEQVVVDIEEHLLGVIVEDMVSNFLL